MKEFDSTRYIETFSQLPFSAVYAIEDPSDQLGIFNHLILKQLDEHAPLKRIRVTRPSAPWMKDLDIVDLQNRCRNLRYQCQQTKLENDWKNFRQIRNELKSKIRNTKRNFYRKALSSKRPKEVWNIFIKY